MFLGSEGRQRNDKVLIMLKKWIATVCVLFMALSVISEAKADSGSGKDCIREQKCSKSCRSCKPICKSANTCVVDTKGEKTCFKEKSCQPCPPCKPTCKTVLTCTPKKPSQQSNQSSRFPVFAYSLMTENDEGELVARDFAGIRKQGGQFKVQIELQQAAYLYVLGTDGTGQSVHYVYPNDGSATRLPANKKITLPARGYFDAADLDGNENLLILFSQKEQEYLDKVVLYKKPDVVKSVARETIPCSTPEAAVHYLKGEAACKSYQSDAVAISDSNSPKVQIDGQKNIPEEIFVLLNFQSGK